MKITAKFQNGTDKRKKLEKSTKRAHGSFQNSPGTHWPTFSLFDGGVLPSACTSCCDSFCLTTLILKPLENQRTIERKEGLL